jgi:hypothetical protein
MAERAGPPLLAVGLLSAAALAYEVLLTRLFTLIQWHHFAWMIISVAMLGWGAAGTLVSLLRELPPQRFRAAFAGAAALFGVAAVACFALAQAIPFNPLEAFWDAGQFLRLALIYLCLLLPFMAAATALCLAFARFGETAPRLYGADILGAGLGSLGVIALLFLLPPLPALGLAGGLGLLAAALALGQGRPWPARPWSAQNLLLVAAALLAFIPGHYLALRSSDYKDLSQARRVMGARVVAETTGPMGVLTVLENRRVPLRYAPGLSLAFDGEPPEQLAVFIDGDGPAPITHFDGRRAPLAYLDAITSALPYHLLARPRVLVLGAGTGQDVLQALYHQAARIDAVEANPQVIDLVQRRFADFSGRPYSQPGVRVHFAEGQAYVAGNRERYDLIQLDLVDTPAAAGLGALAVSHLYTREAFAAYLARLAPDGILAITRWIDLPPRDLLKLAATAMEALEAAGVNEPGRRLALMRGWKTGTLLLKNGDFTPAQIARIQAFGARHSFDADWYPGIDPAQTNRYNILDQPYFHAAFAALLGPARQDYLERYKYRIAPADDDRPYFFHFFKWSSLPEWWRLRGRGGVSLMEWGYPVLLATLAQALVAGLALTLLPLWLAGRRMPRAGRGRVVVYFTALGLAFMFLEMAFIQKFMLFLGHPLYAVAVVLSGFLTFAGLGSRLSGGISARLGRPEGVVRLAVLALAALGLLYVLILPATFRALAGLAELPRIAFSLGLIAPLALCMGMPFPLGLQRLAMHTPAFIPWAWAINACCSVIAAVLATWLAVHLGFDLLVALAVLCYLVAAWAFPVIVAFTPSESQRRDARSGQC